MRQSGEPARAQISTDVALQRGLRFFITGALLSPLSGYLGILALGPALTVLLGGALFAATADLKGALALLAAPGIYGFKLMWPVTLVILPTLGLAMQRVTMIKLPIFILVGGVSGALVVYLSAVIGFMPISMTSVSDLTKAGAFAGAILGLLFGFIAWRIDYWSNRR